MCPGQNLVIQTTQICLVSDQKVRLQKTPCSSSSEQPFREQNLLCPSILPALKPSPAPQGPQEGRSSALHPRPPELARLIHMASWAAWLPSASPRPSSSCSLLPGPRGGVQAPSGPWRRTGWACPAGPASNRGRGAHFRPQTRPVSPRPVLPHRGAMELITYRFCILRGFLPPRNLSAPRGGPRLHF